MIGHLPEEAARFSSVLIASPRNFSMKTFEPHLPNAKVMAEMSEMQRHAEPIPADVTRMAYGGFTVEVEG
jgi:uncharacterized protein YbaA (DUF1428 family)